MNSERNADSYLEGYFVGHTKPEPRAHCICQEFLFHDKPLRSVDFHLIDTDMLVAASDDKSVKLWQIDPKKLTEV
ncbi:hypothetical protein GQX74_004229 [Glossina fuscipes]|nr:hypothetical protein GQX74_004229 [Glossina fuscipes]